MSTQRQESKLKRNITFGPLMGIAYGQIIGAGIMTMTGIAIGMTGTGVALAYMLSALCTLFTCCPSAILGAALPTTGGEYRYISRLHSKQLGFIYIVTFVVSNLTIALYALSCASYLVRFIPVSDRFIAVSLLVIAYLINLMGNKQSALVTTGITVLLLVGLTLFICFGVPKVNFGFVTAPSNMFPNGFTGFLSALALLSFATGGAQVIANMGSEIVNPHKNIPKVIVISTLSVGVLYGLIALVASGVLPLDVVANQNLALVAESILPGPFYVFFALAAGAGATAKTLNVTLSWISKPILVACEDGMLPKTFATVSKRGVPYKILTFFFFVGLIPLVTGMDIGFISKMGTAIGLLSKVIFSFAFMNLPKKYPEQFKNSVLKVSPTTVSLIGWGSMLMSIVFSASLIMNLPIKSVIGFGVVLLLAVIYATIGGLNRVTIPDDLAVDYIGGGK